MPAEEGDVWVRGLTELRGLLIQDIHPLNTGFGNRAWRVETDDGALMVRRNANEPLVDRQLEARILLRAAEAELAPKVVACCAAYQITQWVDQPTWQRSDLTDPARVEDLTRSLRRLHQLQADDLPAVRWGERLLELMAFSSASENPALRRSVHELASTLERSSLTIDQRSLCHFDLHLQQLIGYDPVQFVDFEYARRANAMLDLAWLVQYHDLTPDAQLGLLAAYYGGADPQIRELLAQALYIVRLLEFFWLDSRYTQGQLSETGRTRLRQLMLVLC